MFVCSSFLFWLLARPMKKSNAAARPRNAAPATAMPAAAPVERPAFAGGTADALALTVAEVVGVDVDVADVELRLVELGLTEASGGKSSPGWSM